MFNIVPYEGCGQLRFGMSQEAVETLLGPPQLSRLTWLKNKELIYEFYVIGFGQSDSVSEITFYPEASVVLDGVDIMALPSGREYLLRRSKQKYIGDGTIILLDLGISVPDELELESSHSITMFARGVMDTEITHCKWLR